MYDCLLLLPTVSSCLLNFKGNSDIERYQMANKKIPFKYTRPVEDWLQEKGNSSPNLCNDFFILYFFIFLSFHQLAPFQPRNE